MTPTELAHIASSAVVRTGDLDDAFVSHARQSGQVCLDVETSGLDWRTEQLGACQFYVVGQPPMIVRPGPLSPERVRALVADTKIRKVFHYALFDLRFLARHWHVEPANVACTKIASRILRPGDRDHSLNDLTRRYLELDMDKGMAVSDWLAPVLAPEQVDYAARDVIVLPALFSMLERALDEVDRLSLAEEAFRFLPVRLQLDLLGCGDLFTH